MTAHNMFLSGLRGVLPCTLSYVAIVFSLIARVHVGCVPALRIVHMYTSVSRVTQVLLPRDTTFGHWRKQLTNATKNSTSPRTWPRKNLAVHKPRVLLLSVSLSVSLFLCLFLGPRVPDRVFFG